MLLLLLPLPLLTASRRLLRYTSKADIWSVGCVAFELLAGAPAFDEATESGNIGKLARCDYKWPGSAAAVSPAARQFVASCIRFDSGKRFSAAEALQSPWVRAGWTVPESPPPSLRRSRSTTDAVADEVAWNSYM